MTINQHDVQFVAQQRRTYVLSQLNMYVVSFVCEAEQSAVKGCLYRCTMWKAKRCLLNGTVEQLCPITFLSEITELKQSVNLSELNRKCCGAKRQEFVPNVRAQCVNALKSMRAVRCLTTPPTVQTSPFRSPEFASPFQVRERECTGLPI